MNDILKYFKSPSYLKERQIEWLALFKYVGLLIILSLPLNLISVFVQNLFSLNEVKIVNDRFNLLFISLVFAPIFEEIICRILLIPRWKNFVVFFITSITLTILYFYSEQYGLMAIMLTLTLMSGVIILNKKVRVSLQTFVLKRFSYAFYLSSLAFGILHLFNYEPLNIKLVLLSPFLIAPAVLVGLFFGLIRMKYGIICAILCHTFINLIALPSILNS